jgi:hypothetical protein
MTDTQLTTDITRPYALMCHLDDTMPDVIWQWTAIYEHTTQLIHARVTCR